MMNIPSHQQPSGVPSFGTCPSMWSSIWLMALAEKVLEQVRLGFMTAPTRGCFRRCARARASRGPVAPEGGLRGLGDPVLVLAVPRVPRDRVAHDVHVGDPDDAAVDVLAREEVDGPAALRGERAALPAGTELVQERVGVRVCVLVAGRANETLAPLDVVLELELDADLALVVGHRQVHDVRRGRARREKPAVEVDELPVELHDEVHRHRRPLGALVVRLGQLAPLTAFSIHSSSPWRCGWPSPWVWSIPPFGPGFTAMSTPGSLRSSGLSSQTICPPLVRSTCRSVRLASRTIPPVTPP